jgi:hypothetical protein
MLPRVQPYQNSSGGDANTGLFEDIGTRSLFTVRVGEGAGKVSSGSANTFIGYESGKANSSGSYDTFVGYQAGALNSAANYSTFIGAYAGRENQRGSECTMIGFRAGELNKDGQSLVAVGSYAMRENVSGTGSVAVGWRAGERNLNGDYNTMIGAECAQDNRSGSMNTMCGFRSGRANFEGNENTYIGAYSGYSNTSGSGNCLVGYKTGESLRFGNCNVAIGAYALQDARDVSFNVAIGPYAGANARTASESVLIGKNAALSNTDGAQNVVIGVDCGENNTNSKNVLIGFAAAKQSTATETVVIGARAAPSVGGGNSVIIGYGSATNLIGGTSNVLIGTGANTYTNTVESGISIGTRNALTSSHSITVGEDIYNTRAYSILMGFTLQSDANNSVLVGNNINIQSIIFFKDPLNFALKGSVLADGFKKLGISEIVYGSNDRLLVAASGATYLNAIAGVTTSNIVNSTNNRPRGIVSPATYDLISTVTVSSYDSVVSWGKTFILSNVAATTTIDKSQYITASWTLPHVSNETIAHSNYVLSHEYDSEYPLTGASGSNTLIRNIRDFATTVATPADMNFYFAKSIQRPIWGSRSYVLDNCNAFPLFFNNIQLTTNGMTPPVGSSIKLAIEQPPRYIYLDKAIYDVNDELRFQVTPNNLYRTSDTFYAVPVVEITDVHGSTYGVSGDVATVNVTFSNVYYFHRPWFLNASNVNITRNHLFGYPDYKGADKLIVQSLANGCKLYVQDRGIYDSSLIATLISEQTYDTYSIERYQGYVYALSNSVQVMRNEFASAYASNMTVAITPIINYSANLLPNYNQIVTAATSIATSPYHVFPSVYSSYNGVVETWVSQNSDTVLQGDIDTIRGFSTNIIDTYNSFPWAYVGSNQDQMYYAILNVNLLPLSNEFLEIRSYKNNLEMYQVGGAAWSNAYIDVSSNVERINYKYFDLQRLDVTYSNIIRGDIFLSGGSISTSNALVMSVATASNIVTIGTAVATETSWDDCPFTVYNSVVSSNFASSVSFPSSPAVILKTYPQYGLFQESTRTYFPFNPFATSNDSITFVATSNTFTEEIKWNISYDPSLNICQPIIHCSMYEFDRTNTVSYQATPLYTIAPTITTTPIIDTYTTYINNNITGESTVNTSNTISSNYSHAIGYLEEIVNYTYLSPQLFSTAYVGSAEGITYTSNIRTIRERETDINNVTTTYPIYDVLESVTSESNATDYTSNIRSAIVYDRISIRRRAQDTYTSNVVATRDVWLLHDARTCNYVYTSNSEIRGQAPSTIGTRSVASSSLVLTSNIILPYENVATYHGFEPFYYLHRNVLYTKHGVYTTQLSNVIVQSNIGPVATFTQSEIDARRIALRLSRIEDDTRVFVLNDGALSFRVKRYAHENTVVVSQSLPNKPIYMFNGPDSISLIDIFSAPSSFLSAEEVHVIDIERGWMKQGTTARMEDITDSLYTYTSTSNYATDKITFFFSSNNVATTPITYVLNCIRNPYYDKQYFNVGLNVGNDSLLEYSAFNAQTSTNVVTITGLNPPGIVTPSKTTFTMNDVITGQVRFTFSDMTPVVMNYSTSTQDSTFTLIPYKHDMFPRAPAVETVYFQQLGTEAYHNLYNSNGPIWSALSQAMVQGSAIHGSNLLFHVNNTDFSQHGFLWNKDKKNEATWSFTFDDLQRDRMWFIPFNPDYQPNFQLSVQCQYDTSLSPQYTLYIKNYFSPFPKVAKSLTYRGAPTFAVSSILERSTGLITDGHDWSPQFITVANGPSPTLSIRNNSYIIPLGLFSSSDPIAFTQSNINIVVDQADSTGSLVTILQPYVAIANANRIQDVVFYVVEPPKNGWLYPPVARFTDSDTVVYQHRGTYTLTDTFTIGLSTTPYDFAQTTLQINVQVRPIPQIVNNYHTYLYFNTTQSALASRNYFTSNIDIVGSNTAFVHILGSNALILRSNENQITTCSATDFEKRNVYFQLTNSNTTTGLYFDFITNNYADPTYRNPLIAINDVYHRMFVTRFDVSINKYFSSNVRVTNEAQNRDAKLRYVFDSNAAAYDRLQDHVFSYYIQAMPMQDLLPSQFQTIDALSGSDFLRTYNFNMRFEHISSNVLPILNINFRHTGITISSASCNIVLPNVKLDFGSWNNILYVNDDSDNGRYGSLYIGYNNAYSRQLNTSRNVLYGMRFPRLSFNDLGAISISIDLEASDNYFVTGAPSNFIMNSEIPRSFELSEYNTKIMFRNQEIYASTYNLDNPNTEVQSLDVHNVVVGKNIIVRGINNVCVGNTFNTSGQYSIVIGNDIGTGNDAGQVNELYQCIIIGNQSFQNSLTRDTISIGNNNFNSLNTYPPEIVNNFLLQKPIIIGNDITEDALDYQINIGNTFLRTNNSGRQLYLGRTGEVACVGYSSNMRFSDNLEYKVRVNGGVDASIYVTSYVMSSVNFIGNHFPVCFDYDGYITRATTYRATDVIGVCVDVDGGRVFVQNRGVAKVFVHTPVQKGDLLATYDSDGIASQGDDIVRSYTVAKSLETVTAQGFQLVSCLIMV